MHVGHVGLRVVTIVMIPCVGIRLKDVRDGPSLGIAGIRRVLDGYCKNGCHGWRATVKGLVDSVNKRNGNDQDKD